MKSYKNALLLIIIAIAFSVALIWAGNFYWKNLRGVGAAFKQPPKDIAKVINTTGMPLKLHDGFSISIFVKDLGKPRVLIKDIMGTLLVSIPSQGRVVALPDQNQDGRADKIITVLKGLNQPHGLAFSTNCGNGFKNCELYVAETDKVSVYEYDSQSSRARNRKKIIDLPGGGNHFTRTILIQNIHGEDNIFISVGSSCNVCKEKDWRRAGILIADKDGKNLKKYASGLRNAVFMTKHPVTSEIWVTEMGRDLLGDDLPPDEINIVNASGIHYGWPYCYGRKIRDKTFNSRGVKKDFCDNAEQSYIDIPAHSAPLGLAFIPSEEWPEEYIGDLLVAFHGSWNRSVPTGYKIVRYKLLERGEYFSKEPEVEDFISGWLLEDGTAIGRPVDILAEPNGVLYVSDDKAGVVYKVKYGGKTKK